MSNWAIVVLVILAFVVGAAGGWFGRGWHDGSTTTAGAAAGQAQTAVDAGIEADRKIVAGTTSTETAVERVRVVERTVTVDAGCKPGAGPVSADSEQQLRALAETRQAGADAAEGAGRVSR